jgi:hypothetical protein
MRQAGRRLSFVVASVLFTVITLKGYVPGVVWHC